MLAAADGQGYRSIAQAHGVTRNTVPKWCRRFHRNRLHAHPYRWTYTGEALAAWDGSRINVEQYLVASAVATTITMAAQAAISSRRPSR